MWVRAVSQIHVWFWGNQPMVVTHAVLPRHLFPHLDRRDYIQHGCFYHSFRIVQKKTVQSTTPAIVACRIEFVETEVGHEACLVHCHVSLGVWVCIRVAALFWGYVWFT